ncbi:MAG: ferredoxin family protein [Candidatus Heimdallarchaeota archaeon]|nr:ferredoxin family protein [Candidatus Heimdallarchaeota archaeon]
MTLKEFVSQDWTIKIDHVKCDGSADCIASCPSDVFERKDNKSFATNVDDCIECCACVTDCPTGAIFHTSC